MIEFFEKNKDRAKVEEVPLKDIHITQPNVQSGKIERMIKDIDKTPTINAVQFKDGEISIFDGHHRLVSLWSLGKEKIKVNLVKETEKEDVVDKKEQKEEHVQEEEAGKSGKEEKKDDTQSKIEENSKKLKEMFDKMNQTLLDGNIEEYNQLSSDLTTLMKEQGELSQKSKYDKGKESEDKFTKLGATDQEIKAIRDYTSSGYQRLNKDLRRGEKLDSKQQDQVNQINNLLSRLPEHKGKVYRGMGMPDDIESLLEQWKSEGIMTMKSFTSSSRNQKVSSSFGSFRMEINSKSGRDISEISSFGSGEEEVLFKTDTKFKIKSIRVKKLKNPITGNVFVSSIEVKLDEI